MLLFIAYLVLARAAADACTRAGQSCDAFSDAATHLRRDAIDAHRWGPTRALNAECFADDGFDAIAAHADTLTPPSRVVEVAT